MFVRTPSTYRNRCLLAENYQSHSYNYEFALCSWPWHHSCLNNYTGTWCMLIYWGRKANVLYGTYHHQSVATAVRGDYDVNSSESVCSLPRSRTVSKTDIQIHFLITWIHFVWQGQVFEVPQKRKCKLPLHCIQCNKTVSKDFNKRVSKVTSSPLRTATLWHLWVASHIRYWIQILCSLSTTIQGTVTLFFSRRKTDMYEKNLQN